MDALDFTTSADAAEEPTCVSYTRGMHVVGSCMCAMIATSNLLTIVTLMKVKRKVGSKNRLYVISVACADLLMTPGFGLELVLSQMGFLCDDRHAPVDIDIRSKRFILVVMFICRFLSLNVSLFTILLIGIDRMLAVSKPIVKIKQQFAKRSADTANNQDLDRIRRFYRMMLITLGTLALLYAPFMIAFKMFGVGHPGKPAWVFTYVGQPVALILMSNSWINPILYACFNQDYRKAYLKILRCSPRNKVDAQAMNPVSIVATQASGLH